MTKRKVNVCLRNLTIIDWGIPAYVREMALRLASYGDLDLKGTIFRRGLLRPFYDPEEYKDIRFPCFLTRRPEWVTSAVFCARLKDKMVQAVLAPFLPRTHNALVGDKESEIFLFLDSMAPFLPVEGKVISCIHDILPLTAPNFYLPKAAALHEKIFNNTVEKSDKIIAVSDFSKKEISRWFHINEEQIDVVPCGVKTEAFLQPLSASTEEQVRSRYKLPERYLLYFGACRPNKNVESVIRAYARLPEATRREYGLVITNPSEDVKICAEKTGIAPCYIEKVSGSDKPAIYKMASLLVWPSLSEGFGIPIIEAMAAGTPVVCSNVTSLPEVAGDAAVLVDPLDIQAIAEGIERCLYDGALRQDLIARGYENIKRFSWDKSAEKLREIIIKM